MKNINTIGIIAAMDVEIELFKTYLNNFEEQIIARRKFYIGQKNGKTIIIVVCGIGKVNAAITTQLLIDKFNVELIINTGIAGSLKNNIKLLDVVIGTKLAYHDFDTTHFGYEAGFIPNESSTFFELNNELINQIEQIADKYNIKTHKDIIVSGDQFISDNNIKNEIINTFNAGCVEMESTAIVHTCKHNNVECLIIRSISDNADDNATINYEELEKLSAKNSALLVDKIIENL